MKRCPECEFIYEDDQSLCDMDGILLVFDSQKLPKPTKLAGFHWRGRIIPALAALVLSTVLVLVYYVSTRQAAKRATYSPGGVTNSQPQPAPVLTDPGEEKTPQSKPSQSPKAPEQKPANTSGSKPVDPKKTKETKTTTTQKAASTTQPQKSDSKVESIFKKTGRILKKPFKF